MHLHNFHQRLSEARKRRGLAQCGLAVEAGIACSQISNYECGERLPSLENFFKLCVALNVSADELLGLTKPKR
jgi:transcriptional regulator with XRE-family HTH domain